MLGVSKDAPFLVMARKLKQSTIDRYKLMIDCWFAGKKQNGTVVYQAFYPNSKKTTAKVEFSKILTIPNISEYIQEKDSELKSELKSKYDYDIYKSISHDVELISYFNDLLRRVKELDSKASDYKEQKEKLELEIRLVNPSLVNAAKERLNKMVGNYEKDNNQKKNSIQQVFMIKGQEIKFG